MAGQEGHQEKLNTNGRIQNFGGKKSCDICPSFSLTWGYAGCPWGRDGAGGRREPGAPPSEPSSARTSVTPEVVARRRAVGQGSRARFVDVSSPK